MQSYISLTDAERSAQLAVYQKHGIEPIRLAFEHFLEDLKAELDNRGYRHPNCFISYTWEKDPDALKAQQAWLRQLRDDCQCLGMYVFLDVGDMQGDIEKRMRDGVAASDVVFLIGTSCLKERTTDASTNVALEWGCIQTKCRSHPDALFPLLYQGDFATSFPPGVLKKLVRDFRDPVHYYTNMLELMPLGLIPSLYGIRDDSRYRFYKTLIERFQHHIALIEHDKHDALTTASMAAASNSFSMHNMQRVGYQTDSPLHTQLPTPALPISPGASTTHSTAEKMVTLTVGNKVSTAKTEDSQAKSMVTVAVSEEAFLNSDAFKNLLSFN
jgi:hypothetical protein